MSEITKKKSTKIAKGGFGKLYKIVKNNQTFAQKQTHLFKKDGNLIGQNLKEISIGYKYMKHENLQKFDSISIKEKNNIVDSKYLINMTLADMTFLDVIYSDMSNSDRLLFFFPILKQLVNGLSFIHSNYICHGDIKPENVLVYGKDLKKWESGDYIDYLKFSNFKLTDYGGINIEYNTSMDKTSTLYYKPPELFKKLDKKFNNSIKEAYGSFNDIWSTGIMMLEYLTKSNIISKIYKFSPFPEHKKKSKFTEQDFLIRFFNCMKSIDVALLLKKKGYDLNDKNVKQICDIIELMLSKKIDQRMNLYNLSIFINYYIEKNKQLYMNLFKHEKDNSVQIVIDNFFKNSICENDKIRYENIINTDLIDIDVRKKAINEYYYFENEFYENVDNKSYISLGLLLFDRLISKNIIVQNNDTEFIYKKILFECFYISSRYLLYEIDILLICDYLNIDIDCIHKDIIEILKLIDFDIYRPTIVTYLNAKNEDFYHSQYVMDTAFHLFCCDHCVNTNYDNCIKEINEIAEKEKMLLDMINFDMLDEFEEDISVPTL